MTISETLVEQGYVFQATLLKDEYDGIQGSHTHWITLYHNNQKINFEYTAGCGHRHFPGHPLKEPKSNVFAPLTVADVEDNKKTVPNTPTLEDAMFALLMDCSTGRNSESFDEFCDNYGYDSDSRSAFKIYEACLDQYSKARKLGVDFEAMDELFEDF